MVNGNYVIDAHCHIYPEKIAAKAVGGTDRFYNSTSAHLGTLDDLLLRAKSANIDHCIVQSVATSPKQVKSINEFIAESVKTRPNFLTGLGTLHPDSADIKGDLEHLIELGLKGVKLHPDIQQFKIDDWRCLKIYELCEKNNLPVLMHTGDYRYDFSNPNRLLPVLKIYKSLTVIGAHFGGWSIWEKACEQLAGIPNFYVDCSSSLPYLESQTAKELIRRYGAEHVLFGTDYPMWNVKEELRRFLDLGLDEAENKSILSVNAKKIFHLE